MNRIGIILALLSAILFGASTPFAKLLLGSVVVRAIRPGSRIAIGIGTRP